MSLLGVDTVSHSSASGSNVNNARRSSYNSSDLNEISVDMEQTTCEAGLKYLPHWPPVNLEFQDLVYTVPDLTKGRKVVLRSIHGKFRANDLTAIMGPSGSGKTSLLNILAGYSSTNATGHIMVNGRPRQLKLFRKMSRYIMQNEVIDPHFTIRETMTISANLKLGNSLTLQQKNEVIDEILSTLRLKKNQHTMGGLLSGGEKKRLSIALELVNNPPVIFLDEPTTGLDDISSSQCISLLRRIAHSGRTIVCSIHTPSAKLFEMFDHVYILAEGECVYQGLGSHIVSYTQSLGLACPLNYNPADFIIEVSCGEYGSEYLGKMVTAVENGRCYNWNPYMQTAMTEKEVNSKERLLEMFEEEIDPKHLKSKSTWWQQFTILLHRMLTQMWRDKSYIKLKFIMTIALGLIVGGIYQGFGNDATKAIFNFGFAFTITIAYLYLPMMPVLLQFPTEVRLLKREYFNQWYRFSSYFFAMTCSKMPIMLFLSVIYITMIYLMTDQPLEFHRFGMLFVITIIIGMTSDSFGILVASRLNIVNAMFVGPVVSVPLILLSCYGIGYGKDVYIPTYMRVIMQFSYLRHGLEGLMAALYGFNRANTYCPPEEVICMFNNSQFLLSMLGFNGVNYVISLCALTGFYLLFTLAAFILIKRRLSFTQSKYAAVQYIGQFIKTQLNFGNP